MSHKGGANPIAPGNAGCPLPPWDMAFPGAFLCAHILVAKTSECLSLRLLLGILGEFRYERGMRLLPAPGAFEKRNPIAVHDALDVGGRIAALGEHRGQFLQIRDRV
jgi:hypothetical protein